MTNRGWTSFLGASQGVRSGRVQTGIILHERDDGPSLHDTTGHPHETVPESKKPPSVPLPFRNVEDIRNTLERHVIDYLMKDGRIPRPP